MASAAAVRPNGQIDDDPNKRKEMQRPGKIENVTKKIHARARCGTGDLLWASSRGRGEIVLTARNSLGEKGDQKDE